MSVKRRGKYFHYSFMVGGTRYRGTCGKQIKTQSQAEKHEAVLIAEVLRSGALPTIERAPFLADFAPRYLKYVEASSLRPDTKRYYRNGWRLLKDTPVAQLRMDRITPSDADTLTFPGGGSNANTALRTLRNMFSKAVEWKVIRERLRIKEREENERDQVIPDELRETLIAESTGNLHDALLLFFDSGIRPGEVLRLKPEHFLWERDLIRIPGGKTKKAKRYVPMSTRVKVVMLARKVRYEGKSAYMFPRRLKKGGGDQPIGKHTLAQAFRKLRIRLNLDKGMVQYLARHTFATDLLQATGNIKLTGVVLGHSSTKPTERYLHPSMNGLATLINQRNARFMSPEELMAAPASAATQ